MRARTSRRAVSLAFVFGVVAGFAFVPSVAGASGGGGCGGPVTDESGTEVEIKGVLFHPDDPSRGAGRHDHVHEPRQVATHGARRERDLGELRRVEAEHRGDVRVRRARRIPVRMHVARGDGRRRRGGRRCRWSDRHDHGRWAGIAGVLADGRRDRIPRIEWRRRRPRCGRDRARSRCGRRRRNPASAAEVDSLTV